jgi:hypothetical protein
LPAGWPARLRGFYGRCERASRCIRPLAVVCEAVDGRSSQFRGRRWTEVRPVRTEKFVRHSVLASGDRLGCGRMPVALGKADTCRLADRSVPASVMRVALGLRWARQSRAVACPSARSRKQCGGSKARWVVKCCRIATVAPTNAAERAEGAPVCRLRRH